MKIGRTNLGLGHRPLPFGSTAGTTRIDPPPLAVPIAQTLSGIPHFPNGGERGSALYGAAYRVVMDRLPATPESCGTDDLPVIQKIAAEVSAWAVDQAEPLRSAYQHAVADILTAASTRVENMRRAQVMTELYNQIPRPPL